MSRSLQAGILAVVFITGFLLGRVQSRFPEETHGPGVPQRSGHSEFLKNSTQALKANSESADNRVGRTEEVAVFGDIPQDSVGWETGEVYETVPPHIFDRERGQLGRNNSDDTDTVMPRKPYYDEALIQAADLPQLSNEEQRAEFEAVLMEAGIPLEDIDAMAHRFQRATEERTRRSRTKPLSSQ